MTSGEFYEELRNIKANWSVRPGGLLRCNITSYECCPITAVCLAKLNHYYPIRDAHEAAAQLNLDPEFTDDIIEVADHATYYMDQSTIYPALRRQLLEMVHLNEPERAN